MKPSFNVRSEEMITSKINTSNQFIFTILSACLFIIQPQEARVFKKIIALMMIISVFTVNAHAVSQNGLKAAFDELNYSLTVEWDQKDKEFYATQMKKFSVTIRELQTKGLTNAQLVEFVKKEVKNEKVARDVETAFNMISINKMSQEEASNYMMETMKKSYSAGASWNGQVFIYVAVGLLIVAAAIALAGSSSSQSDGYSCYDTLVCDPWTCYPDGWGGEICYEGDCYYECL
jgi:hypothetical protein